MASQPLDAATLRHALQNFDTLFAVACAAEREELLKLLIKRIVFRGPDADVTLELFSSANLNVSGSKFRSSWLPMAFEYRTVSVGVKFLPPPDRAHDEPSASATGLRRGDVYRALLDADPSLTRAEIARRHGVSRAAVTQALRLRVDVTLHDSGSPCADWASESDTPSVRACRARRE